MVLKGRKPEVVKPGKPKLIISGPSGVGKTTFALDFEKPIIIDTEGGATREQYMEKLVKSGGFYMGKEDGSQDFKTIIDQLKELATTKHPYKTIIIDSFSKIYAIEAAKAEALLGNDFGRDKREANKPTRQLMRWIDQIDLTVILICHKKDKWEGSGSNRSITGTTFDGWEKMEYDLDLWIEVQKTGNNRSMLVKKSRVKDFVVGNTFPLDYQLFCKLYGSDIINQVPTPVQMASVAQVNELQGLLNVVKMDQDEIEKWLAKANAVEFSDFTSEQITKAILSLNTKLESLKGGK